MKIRHVLIRNFRGIRTLDWKVADRLVILIGPGDAAKSSLLDAIGLALSPRWTHTFSDSDFFGCAVDEPLVIDVTVTDLPDDLIREDRYGLLLRGVDAAGELHDEPADDHEAALTIRLKVDSSLEPRWTVIKDFDAGHELVISAAHRALLGVFKVDELNSSHLRWTAGSALSNLTAGGDVRAVLTKAQRAARDAVFAAPDADLVEASKVAGDLAAGAGAAAFVDPRPGLEPPSGGRQVGLVLHDGVVPATQLGLGSQRLASIAFQTHSLDEAAIVLVDEIEVGLEPHRLYRLLRSAKSRSIGGSGQSIVTTHSPLVIEAVDVTDLSIVRRSPDGDLTVMTVPDELGGARAGFPQSVARALPSALLSRRIVVCEGKTEVGLLRRLAELWDDFEPEPAALQGVSVVLGGGSDTPNRSRLLADLGFEVSILADDDLVHQNAAAWADSLAAAREAGVVARLWPQGTCIEDVVLTSVPVEGLQQVVDLWRSLTDSPDTADESVRASVAHQLGVDANLLTGNQVDDWAVQAGKDVRDVAAALAVVAATKKWFKDETRGYLLGNLIIDHLGELDPDGPLVRTLHAFREFCYRGTSVELPAAPLPDPGDAE